MPEGQAQRWPYIGIAAALILMLGVAWMASRRPFVWSSHPDPEPEILGIFEEAAREGTYAYDAVSERTNMADRDLLDGSYVMSTTERRRNAAPKGGVALVPTGRECARFVREMAELRNHLGFCEEAH